MKKILVVDDSRVNLAFVTQVLEDEYTVVQSTSAMKAINIMQKDEIDLVLLDIQMPEMDGIEAIKIMKSINSIKDIPIIFLTGRTSSETEIECLNCGAVDFITKPFVPEIVKLRIERTLELDEYHRNNEKIISEKVDNSQKINVRLIKRMADIIRNRDYWKKSKVDFDDIMNLFLAEIKSTGIYREELSEEVVFALRNYGILYDIGKISVDERILLKEGKLTDKEFEKMKKHCERETEIVEDIFKGEKYYSAISDFMSYHHENWDGSGYPNGLKKKEIPVAARIVSMIGEYMALREEKPYRNAYSIKEALDILKGEKDTKYDPMLVGIFCEAIKKRSEHDKV
ncbi:MAG: response regulator [Firmicutes bacterium]|nr:response regulator [Bacillota bacterium]